MRTKAMGVPRLAQLGARCYYTHRASSTDGWAYKDVPRHYSAQRVVAEHLGAMQAVGGSTTYRGRTRVAKPRRGNDLLNKWVVVWPAAGYGTVVGMTYRDEGVVYPGGQGPSAWDGPGEYEQAYLVAHNRYPLYEVRTSLTGTRMLVPPWALVPQLEGWSWANMLALDEPPVPWVTSMGMPSRLDETGTAWAQYVHAWFKPHARAVVPA